MSPASPTGPPAPEPWPAWAYGVALVAYVALGYLTKSWVLNWIVGPLFLVLVLSVVPRGMRRLRGSPR